MSDVRRGVTLRDPLQRPVLVLDRSPDGWWVYVEDCTDERGYPLIVQIPEQDLEFVDEGLF